MSRRANNEGSIYYDASKARWTAAVTIGTDPDTGRPVRRKVSARTKADAVRAKDNLMAKYRDAYYIDADRITVGEWLDKYLTTYKQGSVRANTYESYRTIASAYILPRIGRIVLDKLVPQQVQQMVSDIAASKSPRTAAYALTVLRMATRRAVDDSLISRDPTRGVKRPYAAKRREIQVITPEQGAQLIAAATDPAMRLSVQILYATGLRSEEMLALTWPAIDLDARTLTVSRVLINTAGGPQVATPKTRSSNRTISIPPRLANDLRAYRRQQAAHILAAHTYTDQGYIICHSDGTPIMPQRYSRRFTDLARRASIDITAHGLRHTHATQLFAAGWAAKDVQTRLGHSTISITLDTYTHYIPSRGQDIAAYLDTIYPSSSD